MVDLDILCVFAFAAGLIDAAVGGGGLIQIPALFHVLPASPPAALLG
ncbi:sulfite exporter TauE/SafE family protein, partial [Pseudomonas frederiksbergensis]|nr:sulfite exporter TauE/SafE family protein [Pseudomonas frederiksbergensis]